MNRMLVPGCITRYHGGTGRPKALCLLLPLFLRWLPACATTQAEHELYTAPMPHVSLGAGGKLAKVHLVSLLGYVEGKQGNAARLSEMHAQVQDCVRDKRSAGLPARPPTVWPDHDMNMRVDTYSSVNRSIRYTWGLSYGVNQNDCSLLETSSHTASLFSSKGTCEIDLRVKTAHGVCDPEAHANARPPVRRPALTPAQLRDMENLAAHDPATTATLNALRQLTSAGTGERKVILGLECDVQRNPFEPDGTVCMSRGGTFVAQSATGATSQSSMGLESYSPVGGKMHAEVAKLDTMVDAAVFAPYLTGGFSITRAGGRK